MLPRILLYHKIEMLWEDILLWKLMVIISDFRLLIKREFFKNFFKLKRLRFTSNTSGFFNITEREMQVLNRMVNGMNNNQIAKDLHVSVCTAKAHVSNIYTKLSVKSRIKAVVKAIKNKIVNI